MFREYNPFPTPKTDIPVTEKQRTQNNHTATVRQSVLAFHSHRTGWSERLRYRNAPPPNFFQSVDNNQVNNPAAWRYWACPYFVLRILLSCYPAYTNLCMSASTCGLLFTPSLPMGLLSSSTRKVGGRAYSCLACHNFPTLGHAFSRGRGFTPPGVCQSDENNPKPLEAGSPKTIIYIYM